MGLITLVLGGVASGKSAFAESLLSSSDGPVTYYATLDPGLEDVEERIRRHRGRRPEDWRTVECGADLSVLLARDSGRALVDSLGSWILHFPDFAADETGLVAALRSRRDPVVMVSEETGLAPLAPTVLGIAFQEALGRVNQAVASVSNRVCLVVAGRVVEL